MERESRPVIEVAINGAERYFLVDTGAETTSITPETAAALGLPIDPWHRTLMVTADGRDTRDNRLVGSLRLGGIELRSLSVAVFPMRRDAATVPLAGVLGADVLSAFDVEVDVPHATLGLDGNPACGSGKPDWTLTADAVPMVVTAGRRILLPVRIDGRVVSGLFDTGADRIFVPQATMVACGADATAAAHVIKAVATSGGGGSLAMSSRVLDSVQIGEARFRNVSVMSGEFPAGEADLLIGASYMRDRRFFISYATRTIYIEAPGRPAPVRPFVLASAQ